ncbi:MAG: SGNH/GDSL hydrolase family protein [Candidatus Saccharimonadales bacterium]
MRRVGALFILTFVALTLFVASRATAESGVDWTDANQPFELHLEAEDVVPPNKTYWNIPCEKRNIAIMQYDSWSVPLSPSPGEDCVAQTSFGYFVGSNMLALNGTNTAYQLASSTGSVMKDFFVPVPNTNAVVQFNSKMRIYHNMGEYLEPIYSTSSLRYGQVDRYKYTQPIDTSQRVTYSNGVELAEIKPSSISFSRAGGVFVVNIGRYQAAIDVNTRKAIKFGIDTIHPGTNTADMTTSLSSTGKYVITNDINSAIGRVYDISACSEPSPGALSACPVFDYESFVKERLGNNVSIVDAKFASDYRVVLYVSRTENGAIKTSRYSLSIADEASFKMEYLGLGDSYASGEGAYGYMRDTDNQSQGELFNMCHLSRHSYPYLMAAELGYGAADSVACSGAKIKDIFDLNDKEYERDDPQSLGMDGVSYNETIFANYLPGYRRQVEFVKEYRPKAITLSIGGNDIGFGKKLESCLLSVKDCFQSEREKQEVYNEIVAQFDRLTTTYRALKDASGETAIYVLGYPQIAKKDGDCAVNVRLSARELEVAEAIIDDLNEVIRLAAKRAGVFYVDVSEAFYGKRLCEDRSWKLAMNGITMGNDVAVLGVPLIGKETYHPNQEGHRLYARTILAKTNNLTAPMPESDEAVDPSEMDSSLVPSVRQVDMKAVARPSLQDAMTSKVVYQPGDTISELFAADGLTLRPNGAYTVTIHSEPQTIGTAHASDMHNAEIAATIPAQIEPGIQSIHITGSDIEVAPLTCIST